MVTDFKSNKFPSIMFFCVEGGLMHFLVRLSVVMHCPLKNRTANVVKVVRPDPMGKIDPETLYLY